MKYPPTPVAYGQSCINMNTRFSCRNNCIYCFGKNWKDRHMEFEPEDMVKQLPDHVNIPIGINNSASDPLDPKTWPSTYKLMQLLVGKASTVMLITKEYVSKKIIRQINSLDLHVIFFISYSGLPEGYEYLVDDRRMESLANLHMSNIPTVLYARPLIKLVNDFDAIEEAAQYVKYIVWSSVRVDNNNAHPLLPEPTGECLHKSHKRIADDEFNYIETRLRKMGPLVFRKTSCVISYINKTPDYNAHWSSPDLYGCHECPVEQKKRCQINAVKTPEYNDSIGYILIKYKLPKYRYSVQGAWVLDNDMATFSCLRAGILRKLTGFQVKFEDPYITSEPILLSAEDLAYKHYELRGEKEGNVPI